MENIIGKAYYVSPNGSDENSGLTPEAPLKTPQAAASKTAPGDTVYFMDGVFTCSRGSILNIRNSGTEDAYITYTAMKGEKPIFKVGGDCWDAVIINANYIIIDGLTLKGINDEITVEEGRRNYELFLRKLDTGEDYDEAQMAKTNTNGIAMNGRSHTAAGKLPPHHAIIRNCDISMFPAGGVGTLDCDYVTIENNHIYNNMWFSLFGASGISVLGSRDIDTNYGVKNIIRNNIVHDNKCYVMCKNGRKWSDGNGIIIDYNKNTGSTMKEPYKGGTLIENNICYGNGGGGIHCFNSSNIDVINNTCYNNGRTPALIDWGNLSVNWCTNVKFINNIAVACEVGATPISYGAKNNHIVVTNNIHYNMANPDNLPELRSGKDIPDDESFNRGNIWADPKFADAENGDFHLLADSIAVDTGTGTMAPSVDIDGKVRPQGENFDIGAYESSFVGISPAKDNDVDFDLFGSGAKVIVEEGDSARGIPVIDAEIDDIWANTQKLLVKKCARENGATAVVRTMWDDEHLYVLAEVKDSCLNADSPNSWEQDSVEFFIDEDNRKPYDYDRDDAHYRVNFKNELVCGIHGDAEKFKSATRITDDGYIVEAAIPIKSLKAKTGMKLGFDVQINDADASGKRFSIAKWSDSEGTTFQDASRFGELLLVDWYLHKESDDETFVKVTVNGNQLEFDKAIPYIFEGRPMVCARAVFEALGAVVEGEDSIVCKKCSRVVKLTAGEQTAIVDGEEISLDTAAVSRDGEIMIPMSFISKAFDSNVTWDASSSMIIVAAK